MMTATFDACFPPKRHPGWTLLLAQEPDKDLEFDEGLEDDDLNHSKPPSKKPLLWILLLVLAVGIAYWALKPNTTFQPQGRVVENAEATKPSRTPNRSDLVPSPLFRENEAVTLNAKSGDVLLLTDPRTGKPGHSVKAGESMTILDGVFEEGSWMYQVKTKSGRIGWLSGSKLQKSS